MNHRRSRTGSLSHAYKITRTAIGSSDTLPRHHRQLEGHQLFAKMHFSIPTILAIVPLFASASPLAEQPRVTIPLSERNHLYKRDGSVNLDKIREHRGRLNRLVGPNRCASACSLMLYTGR
jgi:hypothetical protein